MKLNWISLTLLASLAITSPAFAHEQLVNQSPKEGETVSAGVVEISLEYTNDLLDLGSGAEIIITGPDGEIVPASCAQIHGVIATSEIDVDQAGDYLVAWRVVSSDGHPIEGTYNFTLVNETGYQAVGIAQPCALDSVQVEELTATATGSAAPDFSYWLLFGSLGVMAAGLFFYLRPRNKGPGTKADN